MKALSAELSPAGAPARKAQGGQAVPGGKPAAVSAVPSQVMPSQVQAQHFNAQPAMQGTVQGRPGQAAQAMPAAGQGSALQAQSAALQQPAAPVYNFSGNPAGWPVDELTQFSNKVASYLEGLHQSMKALAQPLQHHSGNLTAQLQQLQQMKLESAGPLGPVQADPLAPPQATAGNRSQQSVPGQAMPAGDNGSQAVREQWQQDLPAAEPAAELNPAARAQQQEQYRQQLRDTAATMQQQAQGQAAPLPPLTASEAVLLTGAQEITAETDLQQLQQINQAVSAMQEQQEYASPLAGNFSGEENEPAAQFVPGDLAAQVQWESIVQEQQQAREALSAQSQAPAPAQTVQPIQPVSAPALQAQYSAQAPMQPAAQSQPVAAMQPAQPPAAAVMPVQAAGGAMPAQADNMPPAELTAVPLPDVAEDEDSYEELTAEEWHAQDMLLSAVPDDDAGQDMFPQAAAGDFWQSGDGQPVPERGQPQGGALLPAAAESGSQPRPLTADSFFPQVVQQDKWYQFLLRAGFENGPLYTALTYSSAHFVPHHPDKLEICCSGEFSVLLQSKATLQALTEGFSKAAGHPVSVSVQFVPEIPQGSPVLKAEELYGLEVQKARQKLAADPMFSQLCRALQENLATVPVQIYAPAEQGDSNKEHSAG